MIDDMLKTCATKLRGSEVAIEYHRAINISVVFRHLDVAKLERRSWCRCGPIVFRWSLLRALVFVCRLRLRGDDAHLVIVFGALVLQAFVLFAK